MNVKKIFYVWEQKLIECCDNLPAVIGRASMIHRLIVAYGLLEHVKVVRSISAEHSELKLFHTELYLDHLKTLTDINDDYMPSAQDETCGLGYDCPPISDMYDLVSVIAGGSITGAKCLLLGIADVAINWYGGWHHAQRSSADGFCYVNDITIAIEKLKKKFPKILYIDLDVHHGNGVQDAYSSSKDVFTLSFHKYEPGFYPGTGGINDIGSREGRGFACNCPLRGLYSDETLQYAFENIFNLVYSYFNPDAIIVQCGADALARDPHGGAGLTEKSYMSCIKRITDTSKPTLLLGGGGYNHTNTSKLWTKITALVAGVELDDNIPEHDDWPKYGPDYTLTIQPLLAKDTNTQQYLEECLTTIRDNLNRYLRLELIEEPYAKKRKHDPSVKQNDNKNSYKLNFLKSHEEKSQISTDVYEFHD